MRFSRTRWLLCGVAAVACVATSALRAEEPPLPAGLETTETPADTDEPALPEGLGDSGSEPALPAGLDDGSDTPDLPAGLDDDETSPDVPPGPGEQDRTDDSAEEPSRDWDDILDELGLSGFWEVRGGVRTQHDPYQKDASLGESRLSLDWQKIFGEATVHVVGDLYYDAVLDRHAVNLETGEGFLDLRQANVLFTPLSFMDVKAGRQILTWGTGDLLFLNDLFPKDWQAFFIGRDVEYLKAPSDALKVSMFSDIANLDVVYVPRHDASRFVQGRRLSYYNRNLGRIAGRDAVVDVTRRNEWFANDEFHGRLSQTIEGVELAAYGFWGYYKTPEGFDMARNRAYFPRLNVYGGSIRGPLPRGIANLEFAWYDSSEDRGGDDPLVPNSQARFLAGYETDLPEVASDLTVGMQYYVELMEDYTEYRETLPPTSSPADRDRHVVTFRVTKLLMNQNLTLSLFAYYSPTDEDAYLRPNVQYKIDDHWRVECGGNVFFGNSDHTFFGQFERNSNIYASLRYGF